MLKEDLWKALLAVSLIGIAFLYKDMKKWQSKYHGTRDENIERLEALHATHDEKIQKQNDMTLSTQKDLVYQMKAYNEESTDRFMGLFEKFYSIQTSIKPLVESVQYNTSKLAEIETRILKRIENLEKSLSSSKGPTD